MKQQISVYDLLTLIKRRDNPKIIKCLYDGMLYKYNEERKTYYNDYKKSLLSYLTKELTDYGLIEQLIIEIDIKS